MPPKLQAQGWRFLILGQHWEAKYVQFIDLDKVLQSFYAEVRKSNSDKYEPISLASMQAGIDRYLIGKNDHVSIIRDRGKLS